MAVGYNMAAMLFGGFAARIATWLTKVFQTPVAPAFYPLAACIIGLVWIICMRETCISKNAAAPLMV